MPDIIKTSKHPESWKQAKIIAILKPKKPAGNPHSYRPISLLSCLYKLTECIILFCIGPIIDQILPIEQAGFRPTRDTTEQVLVLTSFIEAGFEKRLKTGTVFFDLPAAYDTAWHNRCPHFTELGLDFRSGVKKQ